MEIRRATIADIEGINRLLYQVLQVHHEGRPDLFYGNVKKYNDKELTAIIQDDTRPIFVAVDKKNQVLGYAFCIYEQVIGSPILTDVRTLYIDDLCVDATARGQQIGRSLYEYVLAFARHEEFYRVTLNVWSCNTGAMEFYRKMGLTPYKVGMEQLL